MVTGNAPDADELRIRGRLRQILNGTPQPSPQPQPRPQSQRRPRPPLSADALAAAAAAALHAAAQPTAPAAVQPSAPSARTPSTDDDWWDDLYGDEPAAAQPDTRPASRRPSWMRIPDWRTGQHVDLSQKDDGPGEDTEDDEDQDDEETDGEDEPDAEDEEEPDTGKASAQPRSRKQKAAQSRTRRSRSRTAPRAGLDAELPRRSLLDAYDAIPPRIRWLNVHLSAAAAGYALGWVDYSTRTYAWFTEHGPLNASFVFWCAVTVGCELLRRRARQVWLPVRWLAAIPISSIVVGTLLYGTGWNELDLPL